MDCVFDVGANAGQYARMLRKSVGFQGLVVSVEPVPELAEKLRRSARLDDKWIVVEAALSDVSGEATLHVTNGSEFSSLHRPRTDVAGDFGGQNVVARRVQVASMRLEELFAEISKRFEFRTPFLKLDTQGHDSRIVASSKDAVRQFVGLQSELSFTEIYSGQPTYIESLRLYESLGFRMVGFIQNNEGHFPALIDTDCLMVNSSV